MIYQSSYVVLCTVSISSCLSMSSMGSILSGSSIISFLTILSIHLFYLFTYVSVIDGFWYMILCYCCCLFQWNSCRCWCQGHHECFVIFNIIAVMYHFRNFVYAWDLIYPGENNQFGLRWIDAAVQLCIIQPQGTVDQWLSSCCTVSWKEASSPHHLTMKHHISTQDLNLII